MTTPNPEPGTPPRRSALLDAKHAAHDAPPSRAGERGYALVALIAVMTILALALSAAAPSLRQQAQRELEQESIARGEEVAEAIALYAQYKQTLPTEMKQLTDGVEPFPGSFKKVQILRREAAIDPLSSTGEWKLVRLTDRAMIDFAQGVAKYTGGTTQPPTRSPLFQPFAAKLQLTNVIDAKTKDKPPGGEDTAGEGSGQFLGVVSRSRRPSVLTYYGIERHDRWVYTPLFR